MKTITLQWQSDYFSNTLINDPRLVFSLGSNLYYSRVKFSFSGVYIVWADTNPRTILKVGSGQIKNRLGEHLNDSKVQPYKHYGLYATWAILPLSESVKLSINEYIDTLRGIEKFIGFMYPPKLTERLPVNVDLVFVNIPDLETPLQKLLRLIERYRSVQQNSYGSSLARALAHLPKGI